MFVRYFLPNVSKVKPSLFYTIYVAVVLSLNIYLWWLWGCQYYILSSSSDLKHESLAIGWVMKQKCCISRNGLVAYNS